MTSVCGHVMSLDFISKYNNWDRVDPIELFTCPTEKKEATAKLKMPLFLSNEAKFCDNLVLWLDCDKEGENICFEVMNSVAKSMNGDVFSRQVTYRAKFSAITEKDIKAAFNNLGTNVYYYYIFITYGYFNGVDEAKLNNNKKFIFVFIVGKDMPSLQLY